MSGKSAGYTVGKFMTAKGPQDNFECDSCQFSTLELDRMREHVFHGDHLWPFPEGMGHRGPIEQEGGGN